MNRQGRTRTTLSSRAETLPKILSPSSLVQDLDGRGFEGLLSWIAVHAVAGMGKTRGRRSIVGTWECGVVSGGRVILI
jgi:hypothetical protein